MTESKKDSKKFFKPENKFVTKTKLIIFFVMFGIGVGSWITTVEISLAAGIKKDVSQDKKFDKSIESFQEILKSTNHLLEKMDNRIVRIESGMEIILQVVGIAEISDSLKNYWSTMPRSITIDPFGNPVLGCEWISFKNNFRYAIKYKWASNDSLIQSVEWDKRLPSEKQ